MTTSHSEFIDPPECNCEKLSRIILGSKALAKACVDNPFDYALKLRTGEVIRFCGATIIDAVWIHLEVYSMDEQPQRGRFPFPADRGIDVRLSDIVWVMDAPEGS